MEMSASLGEFVSEAATAAITARGRFCIAVSGGSLLEFLKTGLHTVAEGGKDIGMDKWHFFYVDERCVPLDDKDSNHHAAAVLYKRPWCSTPDENIHTVNPSLSPKDMAEDYQRQIVSFFGGSEADAVFDCVLLGFGEDGHTASLFPDHPLLDEKTRLVAEVTDSPKPPSSRVTFTFPLINRARKVGVVTAGPSKAVAFGRVHHVMTPPDPNLPMMRLKPAVPAVWFCDAHATKTMEDGVIRK